MRKHFLATICCVLMGASVLSACDNNTSKLTADQQFQLQQQQMAARERDRQRQHELDMARAENPAPVIQTQRSTRTQDYEYDDGTNYNNVPVASSGGYVQSAPVADSSGHSTAALVATTALGAAGGYLAGKHLSTPKGQQQVQVAKKKAETGYRFARSKVTSKYRSYKKR